MATYVVAVAIVGLAACFVVGSLMGLRRESVARAAACLFSKLIFDV
jgi:hypothetical protein